MRKLSSLLELSANRSVISRSLVGRAVRLVGALGGVLEEAVVTVVVSAGPSPSRLVPRMRKKYGVPGVRPVTVKLVALIGALKVRSIVAKFASRDCSIL
jgi:hypothetical protein